MATEPEFNPLNLLPYTQSDLQSFLDKGLPIFQEEIRTWYRGFAMAIHPDRAQPEQQERRGAWFQIYNGVNKSITEADEQTIQGWIETQHGGGSSADDQLLQAAFNEITSLESRLKSAITALNRGTSVTREQLLEFLDPGYLRRFGDLQRQNEILKSQVSEAGDYRRRATGLEQRATIAEGEVLQYKEQFSDEQKRAVSAVTRAGELQDRITNLEGTLTKERDRATSAERKLETEIENFKHAGEYAELVFGQLQEARGELEEIQKSSGRVNYLGSNPDLIEIEAIKSLEMLKVLREQLGIHEFDDERIGSMQIISENLRRLNTGYKLDAPEVSVVIPVYVGNGNQEKLDYLFETIDSVLNQDFDKPYELIIVDNGSEMDVSGNLMFKFGGYVKEFKDEFGNVTYENQAGKITIIRKEEHSDSQASATNTGYVEASTNGSKYVSSFNSNDIMTPSFIRTLYDHLEANPTTDMVHSRHESIDGEGNRVTEENEVDSFFNYLRRDVIGIDPSNPDNEGVYKRHGTEDLQDVNFVHDATTMFRANVMDRLGLDNLVPEVSEGADYRFQHIQV